MEQLGNALPDFEKYSETFYDSDRIKQVLALFYKDILDFHSTVLKFFKIKSKFKSPYKKHAYLIFQVGGLFLSLCGRSITEGWKSFCAILRKAKP